MKQLKVYGTRRRGHRERWITKGKGVYKEVRRNRSGKLISVKKWSPKKPLSAETFTEMKPLYIKYVTKKDARERMAKAVNEWEWTNFEAES